MIGSMQKLKGHFLVATPDMSDERFAETVIYIVAHGEDGAMGLVINQPLAGMTLADVLEDIDLDAPEDGPEIPEHISRREVLKGGPVDSGRGFVLHSPDYFRDGNSYAVDEDVCLTATLDILKALARGEGPKHSILALGYCGWEAGQLENELRRNGWLTLERSDSLLFDLPPERKYDAALSAIGVTRATLSPTSGNA